MDKLDKSTQTVFLCLFFYMIKAGLMLSHWKLVESCELRLPSEKSDHWGAALFQVF